MARLSQSMGLKSLPKHLVTRIDVKGYNLLHTERSGMFLYRLFAVELRSIDLCSASGVIDLTKYIVGHSV